tara:strand:+ start:533 stop:733 length:201 start_codon:yes stop_codon:yes gene_type:complete
MPELESKIGIEDVDGLHQELLDILDNQIKMSKQLQSMMEAMKLLMEAVNMLKEEVQDGGQRPIKEQ